MSIGPWEIFIVLIVALLLFGAKKLPGIARTIGKGVRDFRDAMDGVRDQITDTTRAQPRPEPKKRVLKTKKNKKAKKARRRKRS